MLNKKKVIIFLTIGIALLVLIIVRFNYIEEIFNHLKGWFNRDKSIHKIEDDIDDYPEYIYETFLDKDGNEVVIEMEKKTGTIDGEDVIFFENTADTEVVYCHFYQGIISSVDDEKIIFLVDKECKNVDLDESYYDYKDVEDYEIEFIFNEYMFEDVKSGVRDRIAINSNEIKSTKEIKKFIGQYIKVVDSSFIDNVSKVSSKSLDFCIK